jgi:enterochelin esterase family protein
MGAKPDNAIFNEQPCKFASYGGYSGTSNNPSSEEKSGNFPDGKFKNGSYLNTQIKVFWLD